MDERTPDYLLQVKRRKGAADRERANSWAQKSSKGHQSDEQTSEIFGFLKKVKVRHTSELSGVMRSFQQKLQTTESFVSHFWVDLLMHLGFALDKVFWL